MKSVLISIRPKWVEKIASGEKTIEVRKTAPKDVPFKCYIYETKFINHCNDCKYYLFDCSGLGKAFDVCTYGDKARITSKSSRCWQDKYSGGKVIGEFVCDKVEKFHCCSVPYKKENNLGYEHFLDNGVYKVDGCHEGVAFERNDRYIDSMCNNDDLKEMCLSAQEVFDYIGIGKYLYGLNISALKIYDKPKEIWALCKYGECEKCGWNDNVTCFNKGNNSYKMPHKHSVKRPPQSWQYVEEL